MNGRRLWFVGIGGAGLSAYAQLARAWGAEVGGWDRVRTPYLEPLAGVPIEISPEPVVPDGLGGGRLVGVPRRARAYAARSSCASSSRRGRRSSSAGSHGKGTTAAMIAFVLRETGRDPAWLIGAPVPQLGSNAGLGGGLPGRRGGRVGPHGRSRSRPRSPSSRTSSSTTTPSSHPPPSSRPSSTRGSRACGTSCATRRRSTASLPCPGEHNRQNAGAALAALELAGVSRDEAAPALARFTGTGRRFEVHEAGG